MTRTEIITLVLNRVGNQSGNVALTAAAKLELTQIQERLELEESLPWFLISEYSTLSTTAGESRIVLPTDFLLEVADSHLYVIDSDGVEHELVKDDNDALKAAYVGVASALPEKYALIGNYFRLFPVPDAVYTVKMMYYAKGATLTDSVLENVWTDNASDLLLAELGVVVAGQYHKDTKGQTSFEKELTRARRRILMQTTAREEANVSRYMGD